ncbi:ATP-binding cassette domain-containing protein (plasmid) [Phaeobacter sp. BS34]|uniref:ATP-binding cassette domain-containing protein n=1 Tax=Phaeobacter sp. BS34 TaxID=2907240 RepID=UPI00370441BA
MGPSGAGKTTLARALVGLQPLVRGHVRIDDAALTDWDPEQIGRHIGFLPQQVELFRGTVAENIAMMDPSAKPSDVVAAAKLARVHELILALPGGYNAEVGPRGSFLSAGQRQRIGLARAFFGERKLIVLDEPNANLDPEGEEALAAAIEEACARGAIVVVVTHRLNLLRRVSHAALVQEGRIARFGEARQIIEAAAQPISSARGRSQGHKFHAPP